MSNESGGEGDSQNDIGSSLSSFASWFSPDSWFLSSMSENSRTSVGSSEELNSLASGPTSFAASTTESNASTRFHHLEPAPLPHESMEEAVHRLVSNIKKDFRDRTVLNQTNDHIDLIDDCEEMTLEGSRSMNGMIEEEQAIDQSQQQNIGYPPSVHNPYLNGLNQQQEEEAECQLEELLDMSNSQMKYASIEEVMASSRKQNVCNNAWTLDQNQNICDITSDVFNNDPIYSSSSDIFHPMQPTTYPEAQKVPQPTKDVYPSLYSSPTPSQNYQTESVEPRRAMEQEFFLPSMRYKKAANKRTVRPPQRIETQQSQLNQTFDCLYGYSDRSHSNARITEQQQQQQKQFAQQQAATQNQHPTATTEVYTWNASTPSSISSIRSNGYSNPLNTTMQMAPTPFPSSSCYTLASNSYQSQRSNSAFIQRNQRNLLNQTMYDFGFNGSVTQAPQFPVVIQMPLIPPRPPISSASTADSSNRLNTSVSSRPFIPEVIDDEIQVVDVVNPTLSSNKFVTPALPQRRSRARRAICKKPSLWESVQKMQLPAAAEASFKQSVANVLKDRIRKYNEQLTTPIDTASPINVPTTTEQQKKQQEAHQQQSPPPPSDAPKYPLPPVGGKESLAMKEVRAKKMAEKTASKQTLVEVAWPDMDDLNYNLGESPVVTRPHLCEQTKVVIGRLLYYNAEMKKRLGELAVNTPFADPELLTAKQTGFTIATVRRCGFGRLTYNRCTVGALRNRKNPVVTEELVETFMDEEFMKNVELPQDIPGHIRKRKFSTGSNSMTDSIGTPMSRYSNEPVNDNAQLSHMNTIDAGKAHLDELNALIYRIVEEDRMSSSNDSSPQEQKGHLYQTSMAHLQHRDREVHQQPEDPNSISLNDNFTVKVKTEGNALYQDMGDENIDTDSYDAGTPLGTVPDDEISTESEVNQNTMVEGVIDEEDRKTTDFISERTEQLQLRMEEDEGDEREDDKTGIALLNMKKEIEDTEELQKVQQEALEGTSTEEGKEAEGTPAQKRRMLMNKRGQQAKSGETDIVAVTEEKNEDVIQEGSPSNRSHMQLRSRRNMRFLWTKRGC